MSSGNRIGYNWCLEGEEWAGLEKAWEEALGVRGRREETGVWGGTGLGIHVPGG